MSAATSKSAALVDVKTHNNSAYKYHLLFPVDKVKEQETALWLTRLSALRMEFDKTQVFDQVVEYIALLSGLMSTIEHPLVKRNLKLNEKQLSFTNGGLMSTHPAFELAFWLVSWGDKCYEMMVFHLLNTFRDTFNQTKAWNGITRQTDAIVEEITADRAKKYSRRYCALAIYFVDHFGAVWSDVHKSTSKMTDAQMIVNTKLKLDSIKHQITIVSSLVQAITVMSAYSTTQVMSDANMKLMAESITLVNRSNLYWSRLPSEAARYQLPSVVELLNTIFHVMSHDILLKEGQTQMAHWCISQVPAGWFRTEYKSTTAALQVLGSPELTLSGTLVRPADMTVRWFDEQQTSNYSSLARRDYGASLTFPLFRLVVVTSTSLAKTSK